MMESNIGHCDRQTDIGTDYLMDWEVQLFPQLSHNSK